MSSERSVSRNTERSHQSVSTSESQTTVKSNHAEKTVSVCRECHKTCLNIDEKQDFGLEDDYDDNWGGPLAMMGIGSIFHSTKNIPDPFTPADPPIISVLPPTPDNKKKSANWNENTNTINNNYITSSRDNGDAVNQPLTDECFTNTTVPTIRVIINNI